MNYCTNPSSTDCCDEHDDTDNQRDSQGPHRVQGIITKLTRNQLILAALPAELSPRLGCELSLFRSPCPSSASSSRGLGGGDTVGWYVVCYASSGLLEIASEMELDGTWKSNGAE
jgi:hypothetical protein